MTSPESKALTPREELAQLDAEIKRLEERRAAIYRATVEALESEKVCADFVAGMLGDPPPKKSFYPVDVHGITWTGDAWEPEFRNTGAWVRVRPCAPEYGDKTFLGILIGRVALGTSVRYRREDGVLEVRPSFHNPAIWVPDLKRVIFGAESFWGALKKPDDLKAISDADINSVWYVRALTELAGGG